MKAWYGENENENENQQLLMVDSYWWFENYVTKDETTAENVLKDIRSKSPPQKPFHSKYWFIMSWLKSFVIKLMVSGRRLIPMQIFNLMNVYLLKLHILHAHYQTVQMNWKNQNNLLMNF